jgi:steroid 5-alpha reductase family enzyme
VNAYLISLCIILACSVVAWTYSLKIKKVCYVDSLWSLAFIVLSASYLYQTDYLNLKNIAIFFLVFLWGTRLSIHITIKNLGMPEDDRYQAIRANNEPNFKYKSLYIIFGLQALLAWLISSTLYYTMQSQPIFQWIDIFALILFTVGITFESVGDWQLLKFKRITENKNKVLNTGLWKYTRHPNYFGDCCVWWSFYLFSLNSGHYLTILSPLLMTLLLLKISGVTLQEKTISSRRPEYEDYKKMTNTFFPGPRKRR